MLHVILCGKDTSVFHARQGLMANNTLTGYDAKGPYLDHTPASPQPITQEPHQQLPQDNAHYLKVVCCLSPDFAALSKPAAKQQRSKLFALLQRQHGCHSLSLGAQSNTVYALNLGRFHKLQT